MAEVFAPKFIILYLYILSAVYIHFRGKIRYKLLRQLTDQSTFLAPYNALIYLFSAVPNKPILDVNQFPELALLRENWETIRDEALELYEKGDIKISKKNKDIAFHSFFKRGWKRFYLKWYGDIFPSAKSLCPKTVELVEKIPSVKGALFALMSPKSTLVVHTDPLASSLRYHLGLATPNSDKCLIYIDGIPYSWRDGQDVLFDETYIHRAVNDTDDTRIILFCDVERPLRFKIVAIINRFVTKLLGRATTAQNVEGERVGLVNKLFGYVYYIRIIGKRLKSFNKIIYYIVKFGIILGILYLIFS